MEKFLIIRLSSLGDIIHTLPAFSALRKHFPEAEISWIGKEKGKEILDLVPGIDRLIVRRTHGNKKNVINTSKEILRFYLAFKNRQQTAIDFQGLIKSGTIAYLSNAKKRIGFHRKNLREPLASIFYTDKIEKIPENTHVIRKNLKLLSLIGINEEEIEFPISLPERLTQTVRTKMKKIGYIEEKRLILLNVGAGWETKQWSSKNWVRLIKILKKDQLFPVILWGNEKEKDLALEVNYNTHIPISPPLSVQEVMALIKEASLVISGDSFPLHAACAFSVPVVGIFGPTPPQRNGPFSSKDKVAFHKLECSYCFKRKCSSIECLKNISAEEVAKLALQLL